jgi:hypothetical protein
VDLWVFGVEFGVWDWIGAGLVGWGCAQAAGWRGFVVSYPHFWQCGGMAGNLSSFWIVGFGFNLMILRGLFYFLRIAWDLLRIL